MKVPPIGLESVRLRFFFEAPQLARSFMSGASKLRSKSQFVGRAFVSLQDSGRTYQPHDCSQDSEQDWRRVADHNTARFYDNSSGDLHSLAT